jgi:hypothetical protein
LGQLAVALAVCASFSVPLGADPSGPKHGAPRTATSKTTHEPKTSSTSKKSTHATAGRDAHGRIKRSAEAKAAFMRQTDYPHGRPGYVVDHVVPLACGGPDAPSNMQWQTIEAAKAKIESSGPVVARRSGMRGKTTAIHRIPS